MRLITWSALVIFTMLSSPGEARESGAEAACIALPTAAQSGCLEKLVTAADTRLNEVYQRAMAMIDKSGGADVAAWKAELKKAQQAWISFRDTDCGALIGYEWGHGTGMGSATESCLLHKTEQRSRELVDRYIHRR
ncbi:MAG TPA: lysozyme inhibitor LprI family protein [Bradyrhizobium sp.]|nr:lysozyme inhibitor LprI family protein [Bradyrhizobium sp.]